MPKAGTLSVLTIAVAALQRGYVGLPSTVVNTVGKEVRDQIANGPVDVQWLEVSEADRAHAALLEDAVRSNARPVSHADPEFAALNQLRRTEYDELFSVDRLDPADNQLSTLMALVIVRALGLRPSDAFLDLGSARGALTFVAASVTGLAAGVELSPSSHAAALEAQKRFAHHFPNACVQLHQGDMRSFGRLNEFDVVYCGVRGPRSRPKLMSDLLTSLFASPDFTKPIRFVCAGFGLNTCRTFCKNAVQLSTVYCIRSAHCSSFHDNDEDCSLACTEALYGDGRGPRLLLEYRISPLQRRAA